MILFVFHIGMFDTTFLQTDTIAILTLDWGISLKASAAFTDTDRGKRQVLARYSYLVLVLARPLFPNQSPYKTCVGILP